MKVPKAHKSDALSAFPDTEKSSTRGEKGRSRSSSRRKRGQQQDLDRVRKLAGDFTGQPRSPLTASIAALLRPFVYLYLCSVSVIVSVTAAVAVTTFVSITSSANSIAV